jgi:hypothetical protein
MEETNRLGSVITDLCLWVANKPHASDIQKMDNDWGGC